MWNKYAISGILLLFFFSACKSPHNNEQNLENEKLLVGVIQNLIIYDATPITDITITDTQGDSLRLSQAAANSTKMVIYLSGLDCASCYEKQVQFLQQAIPDTMKPDLLIAAKFATIREQKLFEQKSGFTTYRVTQSLTGFPLPLFDETPTTFLLTPEMKGFAFFDATASKGLSDLYYKLVIQRMEQ